MPYALETLDLSWNDVVTSAQGIMEDPALPKVIERVKIIAAFPRPVSPKPQQTVSEKGIGLSKLIRPLDAYILYRRKPWILPVAVVGVLLVPGLLGYAIGRRRRP